jgi:hypothetical protein
MMRRWGRTRSYPPARGRSLAGERVGSARGTLASRYFNYRKVVYGGSNEIQRNIIAQHISPLKR